MSESQNIKYKSSWRNEYLRWICGLANAQGGTLYIGKDDSGAVVGVKDSQKLMEDLPNKIIATLDIVCIVVLCRQKQDRDRQNMDFVNVLNRTHKAETKRNLLFYSASLTVALKFQ